MSDENFLQHIGTKRHSGRYPWGSGNQPYQNEVDDFRSYVEQLRNEGLSDAEIAGVYGIKVQELRERRSILNNQQRAADAAMATRLLEKGYSISAIGRRMGKNESSIRSLLDPALQAKAMVTQNTADALKEAFKDVQYLDVGLGIAGRMGVSETKLKTALRLLKDEGYNVWLVKVPSQVPGQPTTIRVLCPPGVTYKELYANRFSIGTNIGSFSEDGGHTPFKKLGPITSIDSNKLAIRYGDGKGSENGSKMDGIIELRRGVDQLSLGNARYAQVRIAVDNTHFLKGMAVYSDNLPDGVDVRFNTNKDSSLGKKGVLKPLKDSAMNPFGATIDVDRQRTYKNALGKEVISPINIVNAEGDWSTWDKSLSSQFLGKQAPSLARKQLDKAFKAKQQEYDEIMSLTNPTLKSMLLTPFSDGLDSAAVHLDAAGFPRQSWAVILPFPDMPVNEIYAPLHNDGERVVLVRYPHGGIFEIPELTVNNRYPEAKKKYGQAQDCVGINPEVAKKLSGADFDGDTVLVIPNNSKHGIKIADSLQGLKGFDTQTAYPGYEGMPKLSESKKQLLMGQVSNLITDMTVFGAGPTEMAAAVRHSMVVIDAEKHNLNYKQSEIDNGIKKLKLDYQGAPDAGAATLLSKAKSPDFVNQRKMHYHVDPVSGKKIYFETGNSYTKNGKLIVSKTKSYKMAETDDAFSLSSGTEIEKVYAEHANKLKALANQARKEKLSIPARPVSKTAQETYSKEVSSLKSQLELAIRNKPYERQAKLLAAKIVEDESSLHELTVKQLKKLKGQAISEARLTVGAKKVVIDISPKEWDAIQAGALTHTMVLNILRNADLDKVKSLATPRKDFTGVSAARLARARAMINSGHTQAEIASALGMSLTTIQNIITG